MRFHFRSIDETRLIGTTTPNEDAAEAKAVGFFAEVTLQDGRARDAGGHGRGWLVRIFFKGALAFHSMAATPEIAREVAQGALERERVLHTGV